jgi:hypothetical protein
MDKKSFPIACAMKKRAKKMAEGGDVSTDRSEEGRKQSGHSGMVSTYTQSNHEKGVGNQSTNTGRSGGISEAGHQYRSGQHGYKGGKENAKEIHKETISELRSMPKPKIQGFAEGGAVEEDDRMLNQHGMYEEGDEMGGEGFHDESYMGNPGNSTDNYQTEAHEEDMISRIMKQREQTYSHGGEVANDDQPVADSEPNDFDLLGTDDDLEFSYTGKNSGDELGDAQEDHDRDDIVARVMKSRAKKDRNPRPA